MRELTAPLDKRETELVLRAPPATVTAPPFGIGVGVAECDDYLAPLAQPMSDTPVITAAFSPDGAWLAVRTGRLDIDPREHH